MTTKIKSVTLYFPMAEDCVCHTVGQSGVTEIKEASKNGEMAELKYYEIYSGDELIAEMHMFSYVEYFRTKEKS